MYLRYPFYRRKEASSLKSRPPTTRRWERRITTHQTNLVPKGSPPNHIPTLLSRLTAPSDSSEDSPSPLAESTIRPKIHLLRHQTHALRPKTRLLYLLIRVLWRCELIRNVEGSSLKKLFHAFSYQIFWSRRACVLSSCLLVIAALSGWYSGLCLLYLGCEFSL